MLYSKLGNTGLVVSRLSLGAMTFTAGGGNASIAKTGAADAQALVDCALEGEIIRVHDDRIASALAARPGGGVPR